MDHLCYFCLVLLCFHARLFVDALRSPARKGLTSWLSFVMYNCDVVTFPLVSWVRCDAWLYRFLIFALFLTLSQRSRSNILKSVVWLALPIQSLMKNLYVFIFGIKIAAKVSDHGYDLGVKGQCQIYLKSVFLNVPRTHHLFLTDGGTMITYGV